MAMPLQDDIVAELRKGPACVYRIADRVMSRDTIVRAAVHKLQERGLVRPKGWESTGKRKRMMFELVEVRHAGH